MMAGLLHLRADAREDHSPVRRFDSTRASDRAAHDRGRVRRSGVLAVSDARERARRVHVRRLQSWGSNVGLSADDLVIDVSWSFAENPHCVGAMALTYEWPSLPPDRAKVAQRVAELCPLHKTLMHSPAMTIRRRRVTATATPAASPARSVAHGTGRSLHGEGTGTDDAGASLRPSVARARVHRRLRWRVQRLPGTRSAARQWDRRGMFEIVPSQGQACTRASRGSRRARTPSRFS